MRLMDVFGEKKWVNKCEINGKILPYDGCSESSLIDAKIFYGKHWEYMGSSYVTYHNGTRNKWRKLHHFFKKVSNERWQPYEFGEKFNDVELKSLMESLCGETVQ